MPFVVLGTQAYRHSRKSCPDRDNARLHCEGVWLHCADRSSAVDVPNLCKRVIAPKTRCRASRSADTTLSLLSLNTERKLPTSLAPSRAEAPSSAGIWTL